MPRIFDNIEASLLPALKQTLELSDRADFSVGYFNLRGWKQLDANIERWRGGEGSCCRLLVGMQRLPQDELRTALSLTSHEEDVDNQSAIRLKKELAMEFRKQLSLGAPNNDDEAGLRRLVAQLRGGKATIRLFLRHTLHAKLYLCFRSDPINPIIGYLGSSNLTLSGLSYQGELNVDVLDHDAALKLSKWFEDRWTDRWCIDITSELIEAIEESWARETSVPPYHIYLKMAYHLSQEARAGLSEFRIPREFGNRLFDYQVAAVKIAAHHLNKRGGVLIGDVVGLGKTLMATAVAKIFQDDHLTEALILCPKNLTKMWQDYVAEYRLLAHVMPITRVLSELPTLRRYRIVLVDESHNLRNREGKRYRVIQEYIHVNESKCILLSATPYNKSYLDLSSQLRLFVPEDKDLGIRPERLLKDLGETEFMKLFQSPVRSLAAFEKSSYIEDWRELMRLYMVRRTRSFIQENYASTDQATGRKHLTFEDGTKSFFPTRVPKTVKFAITENDPNDQYARLFAPRVVSIINGLRLPRYGLGNYVISTPHSPPGQGEAKVLDDLSRAGKRLMGFCRVNLFKRLESSGYSFMLSVERQILRNQIFLYAIKNRLPLPIGTQDPSILDDVGSNTDYDESIVPGSIDPEDSSAVVSILKDSEYFANRAKIIYALFSGQFKSRFRWLSSVHFDMALYDDLREDVGNLLKIISECGAWDPFEDGKLAALRELLLRKHRDEKVLIFSQFADTVDYLERQLRASGLEKLAGVTGQSDDPTAFAWKFSPESNGKRDLIDKENELRILVATDVLSEGQNLQDASIIVNFDLPWAIIRLIQRAGRVDRIGQKADRIICYSFLPADGVEDVIRLRMRVRDRLLENAEVVGTDEAFFEDEQEKRKLVDLYHEKSGILDGDVDDEVDLSSYAYQIWKNATDRDPSLLKTIPELSSALFSTKSHVATDRAPSGVLVYLRTAQDNDSLAWIDRENRNVTESQFEILKAAECDPDTPALPRDERHHDLVRKGVEYVIAEEKTIGGTLGRPSGARFRTYERLKRYAEQVKGTLFDSAELAKSIEEIYRFPLRQTATDTLNRQLRTEIGDEKLAELVLSLREEDRLCIIHLAEQSQEPQIICSMGLADSRKRY